MIVNTNIGSLNAQNSLSATQNALQKSLAKLSSGYQINKASDDAAGLAISEKMRGQISGLNQAIRNAQSAISLVQTAEGALNETHSILQRMRSLAVQSASDTNTADDRAKLQAEMDQLAKEISRISNTTEFNTQNLLAGGLRNIFHIGANAGQNVDLSINAMDAYTLGVAGSTVMAANFNAGTSGIDSISNVGRAFSTGVGYNIDVTVTNAAFSSALADSGVTGTQSVATGDVTINVATDYTGTSDKNFQVRVKTVDGGTNNVTEIEYSTNGGSSWTTVAGSSGDFDLGEGLVLSITDADAAGDYVAGDTYTFTVTAKRATLQLQDGSSNNIGTAVTVYNGATTATLGNTSTGETVVANFTFANLTDAQSATFDLVSASSNAATVVNGVVTVEATAQAGLAIDTQVNADRAITIIDNAIKTVSEERSKLGAMQNRLEHTINNLQAASQNLTSAESIIRDVDMAAEMSKFTKNQILSQAGVAMLAQANQVPQAVLKLLG